MFLFQQSLTSISSRRPNFAPSLLCKLFSKTVVALYSVHMLDLTARSHTNSTIHTHHAASTSLSIQIVTSLEPFWSCDLEDNDRCTFWKVRTRTLHRLVLTTSEIAIHLESSLETVATKAEWFYHSKEF